MTKIIRTPKQSCEIESQYFSACGIMNTLRRYRHLFLIRYLSTRPGLLFPLINLYIMIVHRRGEKPAMTNHTTDIVIEGFPRSANTFALMAFKMVQKNQYTIAHHVHAAAQIIQASNLHTPALVLIRPPHEAIASYMVRHPYLTPDDLLYEYIHFYRTILPYCDNFVVATFKQVTNHFDEVIMRVNERFEKDFDIFHHTEENLEQCFAMIEKLYKGFTVNGKIDENAVSIPSSSREKLQTEANELFNRTASVKLLEQANQLHKQFKTFT